ncbi:MAG TPA: response regulator [Bacteroidetes bacterium]|nr:response regulator [Bacteroidota bacterium]
MSAKILIADDEPFIARSLSYVLEKSGYEIYLARDGEEALRRAIDVKPDLVFLDLMMPKKNGYEVCSEIRNHPELQNVPIILITAKGQKADLERGLEAGANEYMTKPFSPTQVVARVKQVLGAS